MCGLAGFITQSDAQLTTTSINKRARAFEALLIINQERGTHSTGLAMLNTEGKVALFKKAVTAEKFIELPEAKKLLAMNNWLAIGHTRYATQGAINDANAHPFIEGKVVGAHNGVLSNAWELDATATVDSQAIFRTLNQFKTKHKKAMTQLRGSVALTFYNKRTPDSFYMVAHQNPLHLAWVEGLQTYFWSSEFNHLKSVMQATFGTGSYDIYELEEDTLYTFDRHNLMASVSVEVSFKQPIGTTPATYNSNTYPSYVNTYNQMYGETIYPDDEEVAEIADIKKKLEAEEISPSAFELEEYDLVETLMHRGRTVGCYLCHGTIYHVGHYDQATDTLLCGDCAITPDIQETMNPIEYDFQEWAEYIDDMYFGDTRNYRQPIN